MFHAAKIQLYFESDKYISKSKSRQCKPKGWQHKEEADKNKGDDEFPDPFEPGAVGYAGHAEDADKDAAGGREHIGEAVAELECQHGGLTAHVYKVGKLCHDGHGEGCFGGAGGHDDVKECLEEIHYAKRCDFSRLGETLGESVKQRVDYLTVLEYEDDTAGETDHKGCREDVLATCQEELGDVVGPLTVEDAGDDAHGKEEGRDLGDIPSEFQHADHKGSDGEQEKDQYKNLARGESGLLGAFHAGAPVVVEFVYRAALRFGFDAVGIPEDEGDAYDSKDYPAEETVLEA